MTCPNCNKPTSRMIVYPGGVKACASCLGLSETKGAKLDGILTRTSDRVREQQLHHEGDMITPHVIDRATKQIVPNPEFMKRYPEKITSNYTQAELEKAGNSKVGKLFKQDKEKRARNARQQDSGVTFRTTPK